MALESIYSALLVEMAEERVQQCSIAVSISCWLEELVALTAVGLVPEKKVDLEAMASGQVVEDHQTRRIAAVIRLSEEKFDLVNTHCSVSLVETWGQKPFGTCSAAVVVAAGTCAASETTRWAQRAWSAP